ncbi:hypothetical protein TNCV_1046231 [Trichonephila clavipes]|nr:hypothetical protein TNCV_1046231 [Trichonephila clavipes]
MEWPASLTRHKSNRERLGRSRKTSCWPPTTPTNSPRTGKSSSGRVWDRIPQLVINSLIDSMPQRCSALLAVRGNHTSY